MKVYKLMIARLISPSLKFKVTQKYLEKTILRSQTTFLYKENLTLGKHCKWDIKIEFSTLLPFQSYFLGLV